MAGISLENLTISKMDEKNLVSTCAKLDIVISRKGDTRLKNGETISWKSLFAYITPGIKFKTSFKKTCDKYYEHFATVTKPFCEIIVSLLSLYGMDKKNETVTKEAATLIIKYDNFEKGLAPRLQNSKKHYKFKGYKKLDNYEIIIKLVQEINKLYEEKQKPLCWENTPPAKVQEMCQTVVEKCKILIPLLKFDRELITEFEQIRVEAEKIIKKIESIKEEEFDEAHLNYNDMKIIKEKIQKTIDSRKLGWQDNQLVNYLEAQKQWLEHFDKSAKSVPGINLLKEFNARLERLFKNTTEYFKKKAREANDGDTGWFKSILQGIEGVSDAFVQAAKKFYDTLWQGDANETIKIKFDGIIEEIKKHNNIVFEKLNKVNQAKKGDSDKRKVEEELRIKRNKFIEEQLNYAHIFDSNLLSKGLTMEDIYNKSKQKKVEHWKSEPQKCTEIIDVKTGKAKESEIKMQYDFNKGNWTGFKYPYYQFIRGRGAKAKRIENTPEFYNNKAVCNYLERCWESGEWLKK